jgi:hypothetical protein
MFTHLLMKLKTGMEVSLPGADEEIVLREAKDRNKLSLKPLCFAA